MATRTVIELVDDLDGSEATETLRFALDGTDYEIDLAGQNAEALRGVLTRYAQAAGRSNRTGDPAATRLTASRLVVVLGQEHDDARDAHREVHEETHKRQWLLSSF